MLWKEKTQYQRKDEFTAEEFYDRTGIWVEFSKIVCISVGFFSFKNGERTFRLTTFKDEEKIVLQEFANLLQEHFSKPHHLHCTHNGKEFDFPFIARKMLIHDLALPLKLNLFGKKPWEILHLDTLVLWKFGDYKHFTSLKLLTNVLKISSPKDDISGSDVRNVFYEDRDLDKIVSYFEKDVLAIEQIILKLRQEKLLKSSEVVSV